MGKAKEAVAAQPDRLGTELNQEELDSFKGGFSGDKKYPWEIWLDPANAGKGWRILHKQEFDCQVGPMEHMIRKRARKAGVKVSVNRTEHEGVKGLVIKNLGRIETGEAVSA